MKFMKYWPQQPGPTKMKGKVETSESQGDLNDFQAKGMPDNQVLTKIDP